MAKFIIKQGLTHGSGRKCPTGGSGAIGAPSSIIEQLLTFADGNELEIILPVSRARVMVDQIISVQGIFEVAPQFVPLVSDQYQLEILQYLFYH